MLHCIYKSLGFLLHVYNNIMNYGHKLQVASY